jgi:tetratricopeptide (TPR) repeat protein
MRNGVNVDLSPVRKAVRDRQISQAIARFTADLGEPTASPAALIQARINRAVAHLALAMATAAIADCKEATAIDSTISIGYFLQGVAYLWISQEMQALSIWSDGLDGLSILQFYSLMFSLVNNPNFRAWLFRKRFHIASLFTIIDKWDQLKVFTDSDEQAAFDELRTRSQRDPIVHFSQIIEAEPKASAYKGRGFAYCLVGDWEKAIEDFSMALQKGQPQDNTLKLKAYAHIALGQFSSALLNLAQYQKISPLDHEGALLRACTELRVGHYLQALHQFKALDESLLESQHWLAYAMVLYHFGLFAEALTALSKCGNHDSKFFHTKFLVHKGLGELDAAEAAIMEAIKEKPSFAIVRLAGDFFFDRGNPQRALEFYAIAKTERPNDGDTMLTQAQAFLSIGDFRHAMDALEPIATRYFQRQRQVDLALHSQMSVFSQPSRGDDIFRIAANQLLLLQAITRNWNQSILAFPREFFPTRTEFVQDDTLMPSLSEDHQAMLIDADRLGWKCAGVGVSRVVARVLGFCVLRFCYLMTALRDDRRVWELALDDLKVLLSFADFRQQVFHCRSDLGTTARAHTYKVVVENGAISRFARMRPAIFQILHTHENITDVRELVLRSTSGRYVIDSLFEYHYLPDRRLETPSLVVTNSAIFGVDVSVQLRAETIIAKKYETEIQEGFHSLFLNKEEPMTSLARIMLMIWLLHPLPVYSEELAHVVFHAALLALKHSETAKRLKRSLFVQQIVVPDLGDLRKALQARPAIDSQVRPGSLAIWNELPTFALMFRLLRFEP